MRFGEGIIMEFILLEDCCKILDSLRIPITASDREKGVYPYYGANGIQDYVSSYIFDDDLVLLAEDGGSFGSKTKPIAYRVSGKCWVNNHAHVLKPKEGMDVDFLCYSLMFYNTDGLVNGATRQKLTQSAMRKMKIPKLHIDVQRNIVKEMKYVKSIIEIRGKQLEKLSLLVSARFVESFGNPVLNNKGWEQKLLGDITLKIGSGATPKGGKRVYKENGIAFIRSMNVHSGYFEYKDLAYISDEQAHRLDNVNVEEYDVLLNITGASVARCCMISSDVLPARVNQHVCIIRCKRDILSYFLNYLLIENNFQELLLRIAGTGATREAITKQQIENLNIIVPPIQLQNEFATFVEHVNKSKFLNLYHHKSIYTKPQLCCKMVIVNDFLNTKRF